MDGDGGGWRSPAAAERGRIEETAGTTEGEVGEEREACQHFVRTSWRGKHKQTASESSRGREERRKAIDFSILVPNVLNAY